MTKVRHFALVIATLVIIVATMLGFLAIPRCCPNAGAVPG
jgi:hypothetical protein